MASALLLRRFLRVVMLPAATPSAALVPPARISCPKRALASRNLVCFVLLISRVLKWATEQVPVNSLVSFAAGFCPACIENKTANACIDTTFASSFCSGA
jgi:hypothetical protein